MTRSPGRSPGRTEKARAKAAAARRRRALGLDAIVDVALRLVDREGVDAVSMRRVAAEFDTGPASLYAYVPNKEALLNLVLDRVIEEIEIPETGRWQDVVRSYCLSVHEVMSQHNDIAKLSFAHIPSGTRMVQIIERLLADMLSGGVPPKVATWAMDVTALYITANAYESWLRLKQAAVRDVAPEQIDEEVSEGFQNYFGALAPADYPNVIATMDVMASGTAQERFEFGLDLLIAGIEAQINR